ncbi:MAG TPA: hypothetical protein VJY33_12830, partial [Isosphaeraceae bacterium]|nr:hypothetical protein [Isosphaeraceae bacterium]
MMISPQAGVIAPGTTVSEVQWSSTKTIVTLSQALIGSLSTGQSVTFTFPLSSGIVQHVESLPIQVPWFTVNVFIPASVATAILPLNAPPPPPPPPPEYLNIALVANRRTEQIAVNNPFYNVVVSPGDPPTPDQYQALPTSATSLYLTLPPPPGTTPINLSLPSDGSAPPFDGLISAMKQVQQADTTLSGVAIKALWQNTAQCTRLAYEIVWSNQNNLPPLPDPLESLYTIPPATGSSSNSTGSNLEQDRQKFEGTLNSFYSTRNATAERLTKFVVAASAAVYCELRSLCELQSLNATEALLEFPVDPELPTTSATVETEVLLQGLGTPGGINFGVPAAFFYALGANFDKSTTADVRYQTSTGDTVERLLVAINAAVQANVISDTEKFQSSTTAPGINSIQAARRLTALGVTSATSSSPKLTMPSSGPLVELVTAWLAVNASPIPGPGQSYQPTQDDQIWSILGNHLAPPDQQRGYLELVLAALTQGANTSSGTLASQIENMLVTMTANPTVATLKAVTAAQWTTFFNNNPTWLPPFTKPGNPAATSSIASTTGYIATRIRAFIRTVEQFFTVSSVPNPSSPPDVGGPPTFNPPQYDLIAQAVADYPGGPFVFGTTTLTQSQLETAVQTVFSAQPDPAAQAWLAQAFISINELWQIASNVPNVAPAGMTPIEPSLSFSVMEALFARGFRFAKDITALTPQEFQQALTGTVAYPYANTSTNSLYQAAGGIPPVPAATTEGNGTFQPINSQGRLTNCLPPRSISPIGPAKYLQELLNLSEASTCEDPSAAPASGHTTLGVAVAARRGPLANLLASCANLETPLPLIDIVNECLEYLGATQPPPAGSSQSPPSGTIYNTSADQLAGYALCKKDDCSRADDRACHDPAKIFAALPEYSTPAIPTKENQAVEPLVFNNLKVDFSSCHLPYSQALDVSRTYLRQFRTSRFEEMRTFRKCITEFVLDPTSPPAGFQSYLRRYPVRIGTAIEYLGITREEYTMLFQGTSPQPCGKPVDDNVSQATRAVPTWELYGFASSGGDNTWTNTVVILPEFLSRTCLTYCEFLELWKSGFVTFTSVNRDSDARNAQSFPDCEPCCLANYTIQFVTPKDPAQALGQLAVFILLWRKLKEHCGDGYSFAHLADICQFLALFGSTGAINPEFIRQLAAFQMLRDYFHLPLVDHGDHTTGTTGADRTHLLALWGGIGAKKWKWALGRLLEGVESDARRRYGCQRPHHEAVAHLADNLDALSRLAGFNPQVTTDTWNSRPTCTLRFAEVLAKICGSSFREGELLFLFNAEHPQDSEDPFPLQDPEDALTFPLDLPENDEHHSLWKLREALLAVEVREEEVCEWTWPRLVAEFRHKFGYAPASGQDPLLSIGQHFFPHVLEASGFSVSLTQRQYRASLAGSTSPWNSPPGSPFQYDTSVSPAQLWIQVPLFDEAVIAKLSQMPALTAAEQVAVQDLYFMPRADLAFVAFLFPDWQSAEKHLIEECDGANRWAYFRRHFALANARRKVIVEHLANHVAHVTGCRHEELEGVAALVLSRLFSDENAATTPWESDTGATPAVTWSPLPSGGAIAALLGLVGTGLVGEYSIAQPQQQPATNPPAGQTAPQQQQNPGTAPPAGQTTPQQQQ